MDLSGFDSTDQTFIFETIEDFEERLLRHHRPGFGITPSAHPKDNYSEQVWARDFAHAAGHYFSHVRPEAVAHSLDTIFRYQRPDGMLPYRVEREYEMLKFMPGLRRFSRGAFRLIEGGLRGRSERPVYENQDFGGGEDTIPVVLIAVREFFGTSPEGRRFARSHFGQLAKAAEFFSGKSRPEDGLIVVRSDNADWADTIRRRGVLGGVNVWWAQALRGLGDIAEDVGAVAEAERYRTDFRRVADGIRRTFRTPEGYIRAEEGFDRLDTVASVFGALYIFDAAEAVLTEEALARRVARPTGLVNFDPPYSAKQVFWAHRFFFRNGEYHNYFVWPWVTLQNVYVKIKIGTEHPDDAVRARYRTDAVADFVRIAGMFRAAGGAYEIIHPDRPEAPRSGRYHVPSHFMGSLAGYLGVYRKLRRLGWL